MKVFPLSRFIVQGHSMLPVLKPGQNILVWHWFLMPKAGDLVVFQKEGRSIVKRVKEIEDKKLWVAGDNAGDSKDFGWLNRSEVLGKVVWIG